MPDAVDRRTRSRIMAAIHSKNTKPELLLRKMLRGSGFTFQPKVLGKPDFAHLGKRIAVFVDGCFWHKCPKCFKEPKSRQNYWGPKIFRNVERDKATNVLLRREHWKVIRLWEHTLKKEPEKIQSKILKWI